MICPHCGNEVIVPAINLLPNINGCNPVMTTFQHIDIATNPNPNYLTVCAPANVNATAGCNLCIVTTIKI